MEFEILLKIILAAVLGGIIGLEREISHKEAGLRTNILIAIGSALITVISVEVAKVSKIADPGRIAAQIVTGIGFLGAGAIIQARFAVHGLTTAATIWTVAAIGISVGFVVLTFFRFISSTLEKQKKQHIYIIKIDEKAGTLVEIKQIFMELGITYQSLVLNKSKKGFTIEVLLQISQPKDKQLVERIMQLKSVNEIVTETL